MYSDHQRDFVVHGKYAFQHHRIDPRIRHNDFDYPRPTDLQRRRSPYNRYQFSPAEFYNSIQREGRAYDLAEKYRRQDAAMERSYRREELVRPRNTHRSDDLIADDVYVLLADHPALDAREITLEVKDREVILTGFVDSKRSKRLAEEICDRVRGVVHVENRLRIQPSFGNGLSVGG